MTGHALSIRGLTVDFGNKRILSGISFDLTAGRITALLGASGSGKSTAVRALLGLLPPGARVGCEAFTVTTNDRTIDLRDAASVASSRGKMIGAVFQDPSASLDPLVAVLDQVAEVVSIHCGADRGRARAEARALFEQVGLPDSARIARSLPHELSGGQNQRIALAAALAARPPILLADEPTSSLDVVVQARVLELLLHLTTTRGLATLLVTHDLSVVSGVADDVLVLDSGTIVERGPAARVLGAPEHSFTRALVGAARVGS